MPKFFISYRTEDSEFAAHAVCGKLEAAFGRHNVFFDVHRMLVGEDFREAIKAALRKSDVFILVVGPRLLETIRQREVQKKDDYVRYEIQTALALEIPVVPILVEGAQFPAEEALPDDLKPLVYKHSLEVRGRSHLDSDLQLMVNELKRLLTDRGLAIPDPDGPQFWDQFEGRRRGLILSAVAVLSWVGLGAWRQLAPAPAVDGAALGRLLHDTCWITYDPSEMTLDANRQPVYPGLDSVDADLDQIAAAGFNGVLTTSANGPLLHVPRLAKARGLKVIMGLWEPASSRELLAAVRQAQYVDAYCLGTDGLRQRYSLADLRNAVYRIKRSTGRPVAVSEPIRNYEDDPQLSSLGDWLFPDSHLTLKDSGGSTYVDVDRDVRLMMESSRHVVLEARRLARPLIFRNVAYPHRGVPGATRTTQAEFFRRLLDQLNDPYTGPGIKVALAAQTAFDVPWKIDKPFFDWDPYTGLLEPVPGSGAEASTRYGRSPAADEILSYYPHLKSGREARTSR